MVILNSVLPAFVIIGLGYFLKEKKLIEHCTDSFLNNFAYYLILPCMIFASIYKMPFEETFNIRIVAGLYIAGFTGFLISVAAARIFKREKRGSFVTSAFRSNIAYIGFPVVLNLYGQEGLGKLSVIIGFVAPFIIGLSVIYLSITDRTKKDAENPLAIIFKDPLILTCMIAVIFSYYKIWIPKFLFNTIDLLAFMGAPLMLLTVGSGLKIESIKKDRIILTVLTFIKLLIVPFISLMIFTYLIHVENRMDFNIGVLAFSFPTALSSYVLVKKYHNDCNLCAAAITTTTIISLFTISGWTYWLLKP